MYWQLMRRIGYLCCDFVVIKKSWLGEEWDEGASSDDEDEAFDVFNGDDIGDDEDEWDVVAQEPHGFINREE